MHWKEISLFLIFFLTRGSILFQVLRASRKAHQICIPVIPWTFHFQIHEIVSIGLLFPFFFPLFSWYYLLFWKRLNISLIGSLCSYTKTFGVTRNSNLNDLVRLPIETISGKSELILVVEQSSNKVLVIVNAAIEMLLKI